MLELVTGLDLVQLQHAKEQAVINSPRPLALARSRFTPESSVSCERREVVP
jgi:hypothetical protein